MKKKKHKTRLMVKSHRKASLTFSKDERDSSKLRWKLFPNLQSPDCEGSVSFVYSLGFGRDRRAEFEK